VLVQELASCRVLFGPGSLARVPDESRRLGCAAVLLIAATSAKPHADELAAALGARLAARIDGVVPHVPEQVAAEALRLATEVGADGLVSVGGGSATGLAKAVARTTRAPILAVPTTYAGSEMTPVWGITAGGRKTTGSDPAVRPGTVVYDPRLTVSMPPGVTASSGMNAAAHCVTALTVGSGGLKSEAGTQETGSRAEPSGSPPVNRGSGGLKSEARTQEAGGHAEPSGSPPVNQGSVGPLTALFAEQGLRALAAALPGCVDRPGDLTARGEALWGAWLAGLALMGAGTGLHHKICHVLGGSFGLPHADVHAAVLPHASAHLHDQAGLARVAGALGGDDAPGAIWDLARRTGAAQSLRQLGMHAEDVDAAAEQVVASDPGAVALPAVAELLRMAYEGRRPASSTASPGERPPGRTTRRRPA
jgi:maleylacetate reductase